MAVLLLQGPLGPFFNHLSDALMQEGEAVHRICFNGGDAHYSKKTCDHLTFYNGTAKYWPSFLKDYLEEHSISVILAYGDCRLYHIDAKALACKLNIPYCAFEEGYLRPNYITLEPGGVNGYSPITQQSIEAYSPVHNPDFEEAMPKSFINRMVFATKYYVSGFLNKRSFPKYIHHRSFNSFYEALAWIRAGYRKYLYRVAEPSAETVASEADYFLMPLQVCADSQIRYHSSYTCIEHFIVDILESYASANPVGQLVIKHHPMDRGHVNYKGLIERTAKRLGIEKKVSYIHDQHLPTLLKSTLGVVTINSTTALQAFYHGAPVKVMGRAFFDMPGLTDQKTLREFWAAPETPDPVFADRFRAYLLDHGQINGSFYCEFEKTTQRVIAELYRLGLLKSQNSLEMDTQRQSMSL